jgi:hypothetical protein
MKENQGYPKGEQQGKKRRKKYQDLKKNPRTT